MALHNDLILQQPNRLVLDPNLLCENLAHGGGHPVFIYPHLMPIAVACAESVHGDSSLGAHAVYIIRAQSRLVVRVEA